MVHLTNTSRSATFLLGTAMLMLFLFCAPMHAQSSQGFKSTSSYRIANPNYSAQQLDPTTIGHQTYRSTIYTPFGSSTPSSNNPSGNSGSGGSGDPDDDVGIPGWADTLSEPLPIGDTLPLFLFAAAMIAITWIRQRKQQLTTQTQPTNNNDTTQHMTSRKQTYQSLRQKLFLLLAFVCIAGQVSAEVETTRRYFFIQTYNPIVGKEEWTDKETTVGGRFTVEYKDETIVTVTKHENAGDDYYDVGETFTLTATPNEGYEFVGWYNNNTKDDWLKCYKDRDSEQSTTTYTIYSDPSEGNHYRITARFKTKTYKQTITIQGSEHSTITFDNNGRKIYDNNEEEINDRPATITNSGSYGTFYNTTCTLTVATIEDGYTFVGWYEGQNLVSTATSYTYTTTKARNITAHFAKGNFVLKNVRSETCVYNSTEEKWEYVTRSTGGTFTMTYNNGVTQVSYTHNKDGWENNISVSADDPATFDADPNDNDGYTFIGWYNDGKGPFFDDP